MENSVAVIGGNHHNTLGVVRSFGEKGVFTYLILFGCKRNCFVAKSTYVKETFVAKDESDVINIILKRIPKGSLLITTNDKSARTLDLNYSLLSKNYFLPNIMGREGAIVKAMDKEYMRNVALTVGMHVPKSWIVKSKDEIPDDMVYPCITKTLRSIDGGKKDIVKCTNKNDLLRVIERGKVFMVQEFIEKDYELNVLGCSIEHGNCVYTPGVIKKIREYPYKSGSSSFSVVLPFSDVNIDLDLVKNYLKEIKYEGLFSIEFVKKDNINYFLEINLRNDGNGYISTAMGMNLPYIYYKYVYNNRIGLDYNLKYPFYFMGEFTDFRHIRKRVITFTEWVKDLKKVNCFFVYNKKDIRPFFYNLYFIFKDLIRK